MPTLARRLRELDRRVLREDRVVAPERWRREMGRWWVVATGAGGLYLLALGLSFAVSSRPQLFNVPIMMLLAYQAGRLHAEHLRLKGSPRVLGRLRPPGV